MWPPTSWRAVGAGVVSTCGQAGTGWAQVWGAGMLLQLPTVPFCPCPRLPAPSCAQRIVRSMAPRGQRPLTATAYVYSFRLPQHSIPDRDVLPAGVASVMGVLRFHEGPHRHTLVNVLIDYAHIEHTVSCFGRSDLGLWCQG